MPAYKKEPVASCFKARDWWGDETEGEQFARLLDEKFGSGRGKRKLIINVLNVKRRLLNMYITGERRIPSDLLAKLKQMDKFEPSEIWEDGVDPLS